MDDVEKELETERIEESMKEAERQEGGEAAAEIEEERFVLPEAEGQSLKMRFSILCEDLFKHIQILFLAVHYRPHVNKSYVSYNSVHTWCNSAEVLCNV